MSLNALAQYGLNILIAIDQLGTTIVGGSPDETMSSYAHRMRTLKKPWGFLANWIDALFKLLFGQEDHCYKAYLEDRSQRSDVWNMNHSDHRNH